MDGPAHSAAEPPAAALPDWVPRRGFDVFEFARLAEIGVIGSDDRVELIGGELIAMAPQNPRHAGCVARLNDLLGARARGQCKLWIQMPLRLSRRDQPEPDVALLRPRADDYRSGEPATAEDALLVIEVADSSLRADLEVKSDLYAAFGIPEFWVVDLQNDRVVVHREPSGTAYGRREEFRRGDELNLLHLRLVMRLALDDFLPPQPPASSG